MGGSHRDFATCRRCFCVPTMYRSSSDCFTIVAVFCLVASISCYVLPRGSTLHRNVYTDSAIVGERDELLLRTNCYAEQQPRVATPGEEWEVTPQECGARGCHYDADHLSFNRYVSPCFLPRDQSTSYHLGNEEVASDTLIKQRWYLDNAVAKKKLQYEKPYGSVIVETTPITNDHVRVTIRPEGKDRYEVPVEILDNEGTGKFSTNNIEFEREVTSGQPMQLRFTRYSDSNKVPLLDVIPESLVYSEHFLQMKIILPTGVNIYGIGENEHPTIIRSQTNRVTWPLWSVDSPPGNVFGGNLYGVHPFYLAMTRDGVDSPRCHGVLLMNSNAQDWSLDEYPSITWRSTGGIFDIHIFNGPTCDLAVQQYHMAIGKTFMPPIWALGFQLSRYGFTGDADVRSTFERNRVANNIPIDLLYVDIDYMDERRDFTLDMTNFGGLGKLLDECLADFDTRTIIILDPCIDVEYDKANITFDALATDIFIKHRPDVITAEDFYTTESNSMLGTVWPPGKTAFPDFFLDRTWDYWTRHIKRVHDGNGATPALHFHGLWIDMNEPANFDTNHRSPWNWPPTKRPWTLKCRVGEKPLEQPPYQSWAVYQRSRYQGDPNAALSDSTLCLSGEQGDGLYRHYDVHSLYGWSETQASLEAMRTLRPGKRTIIVSRSTFPSSGRWSGHWLGDNSATFEDLRNSIVGSVDFALFGLPYIGADVCGFQRDSWPELCARWHWLGAVLYPYFRNHNAINQRDQDPAAMGDNVVDNTLRAIAVRQRLIAPLFYTLFHQANNDASTAVIKPVCQPVPP